MYPSPEAAGGYCSSEHLISYPQILKGAWWLVVFFDVDRLIVPNHSLDLRLLVRSYQSFFLAINVIGTLLAQKK